MEDLTEAFRKDAGILRTMLDNIADGVYFTDTARTVRYWNEGAAAISGYSAAEVMGRRCKDNILKHVDENGTCLCVSSLCPLVRCFKGETQHVEKVYLHHKEGHRVPVRICAAPIRDANGVVIGGIETFHDISKEISAFQEVNSLKEAALMCPLTAVGNRRYCEQVLEEHLARLTEGSPSLGLLFLDVDNFKSYNDRYGHEVGDIVLKMVARTLTKDLRSFDFIGRWGGEEFLVVLPRILLNQLEETANRLRKLVATASADISKGKLTVTISLGGTLARIGETPNDLVKRADMLMYKSKSGGRNQATIG